MASELLKTLRGRRLTLRQIRAEINWAPSTLVDWTAELVACGIIERDNTGAHDVSLSGVSPYRYWVSRDWGGTCGP